MPIKVYLDHNIWNAVAPEGKAWRDSKWSKLLLPKIDSGEIEIFISPANVMELVAYGSNPGQRNNIAIAMNTIIKGINMLPAYEYSIIEEIFKLIETNWNDTVNIAHIQEIKNEVTRIYIGLIGQLAALPDYNIGSSGYNNLVCLKLKNLIIHLKIIQNPKFEINRRLEQFDKKTIVTDTYLESLESMSIIQLSSEIDRILSTIKKADGNTVQWLQKIKKQLIIGYAKNDVIESAKYGFKYQEERIRCIHGYRKIINEWNKKDDCTNQFNEQILPLSEELLTSNIENRIAFEGVNELICKLFERFSTCSSMAAQSTSIIIDEIINAIQSGTPPTKGLLFDANHSVAAMYCDILITKDGRFFSSCKKLFAEMEKIDGTKKSVVSSENEFNNALKKINKI